MERKVVGVALQVFKNGAAPTSPIRARTEIGRSGGYQLHIRIGPFHQLRCFQSEFSVIVRASMAHLPGAIHLIAKTTISYFPGLLPSVLLTQASHGGIFG